ncbi:MAG: hypothetical protein AAB336_06175 [Acidobacteriota bacterium]
MKKIIATIFATFILTLSIFAQPGDILSPTAKAAFEKQNFEPCIAEMTKLIALKPKNDAAFVERARCSYLSVDDNKDEERILAEKLKTITDKALAEKAARTEGLSRRTKAIADATQAINLNPKNAAAFNIRGLVKSSLGTKDRAEAIPDFDKAIEIDPKFIKPYFNRGSSKSDKGDYNGAIADFTKVLEFEPNNIPALENRSSAFISKYQGGASLEGIDDLVRLSKLVPNEKKYYKYIEYLILKSAYPHGYADTFKAYIAINPNSPEGYLGLARSQASVERYFDLDINKIAEYWNTAAEAYLKYIELNPNVIEPYIELFNLYYDKARNQVNAKVMATRTLAKFPNDGRSYILSGRMAENKQDWATAVKEFSRAIELNPKLSLAYQRRSNAYSGLNDDVKAIADLNKAIETDPRNGAAYLDRGNFNNKYKKYTEAISDFTEADKLKETCAKTYRGVLYSTIAKDNKEPRQTGNFLNAQRNFLADDAKKCYLTHFMYGLNFYSQGLNDQAAQQFNSALTVYKKLGYDTAEIVKWQNELKKQSVSTNSQGTPPKASSGIDSIIEVYKSEAVKQGAKLLGSGIHNSIEDVEFDLVQGETYVLVAVIEGHLPFSIDLISYAKYTDPILKPTHNWNDNKYEVESFRDYSMKSRIVKTPDYSTLQINLGLTTKSRIRRIRISPNKEKGKPLHWIFYKLK